jgi:hypothetical protein
MPQAIIPDPTSIPNGPDIDGWREAQNRLRIALGKDVTFEVPETPVWPDGTQLDRETGLPFDPTIEPVSGGGYTEVTIKVMPVTHPIRPREADNVSPNEAAGLLYEGNMILLTAEADFPLIEGATRFVLDGRRFGITDIMPDGLTRVDRYLVYGEAL